MAELVDLKYKDDAGVVQTVTADIEYFIELLQIPDNYEWELRATDVSENSDTTEFVGPTPK